jgi:hypothetical protein
MIELKKFTETRDGLTARAYTPTDALQERIPIKVERDGTVVYEIEFIVSKRSLALDLEVAIQRAIRAALERSVN